MSKHQVSSFFSIKTQFENVGDALINRELVRFAAKNGSVNLDLSRCPPQFREIIAPRDGDPVTVMPTTFSLFLAIIRARMSGTKCFYFLSPGGYVGERAGTDYIAALINTFVLKALSLIGANICHLGVSYERIGPRHRSILRGRTNVISYHFVRDASSKVYAESLGLRVDGQIPDLAFGARQSTAGTGMRRDLALSFRSDQGPDASQRIQSLVHKLNEKVNSSRPFHFICQVERDREFLAAVASEIHGRDVRFSDCSGDLEACFRAYSSCGHIVANRLHALLIGLMCGVEPVPVVDGANNRKIEGFFQNPDLDVSCINVEDSLAADAVAARLLSQTNRQRFVDEQRNALDLIFATILK